MDTCLFSHPLSFLKSQTLAKAVRAASLANFPGLLLNAVDFNLSFGETRRLGPRFYLCWSERGDMDWDSDGFFLLNIAGKE